jgi:hypothetical protein
MPAIVTVTGSFVYTSGKAVRGLVRFTPCRGWVIEDGVAWATLAPEVMLGSDGSFSAQVTPTDSDDVSWCYLVESPAGTFHITVPTTEVGYTLKELIDVSRPGSRSSD